MHRTDVVPKLAVRRSNSLVARSKEEEMLCNVNHKPWSGITQSSPRAHDVPERGRKKGATVPEHMESQNVVGEYVKKLIKDLPYRLSIND